MAQDQEQQQQQEQPSADEIASLGRLQSMAATDGDPIPLTPEQEQEQAQATAEQSMVGLLSTLMIAAGMFGYRRVASVWNPANCQQFAAAALPVLRKYSWGARIIDFLETGSGAEEMMLLGVAMPLIVATVGAVHADSEELAAAAAKEVKPEGGDDGDASKDH